MRVHHLITAGSQKRQKLPAASGASKAKPASPSNARVKPSESSASTSPILLDTSAGKMHY